MTSEDFNQDMLDYISERIRDGTIRKDVLFGIYSTQTSFRHTFYDELIPLAGWFYDGIRDVMLH